MKTVSTEPARRYDLLTAEDIELVDFRAREGMRRKYSSTPADLAQWLDDNQACPKALRKFAGMTFQAAWRKANVAERDWALRCLQLDGVITSEQYWNYPVNRREQDLLCECSRIVFYEADV